MRHITEFILIATCLFVTAQAIPGQNPVPFLDYPLVPSTVPPGGTGFTLTISGAGFPQGAIVNWNGSPRPTTVVSATQVAATISTGDVAQAGTAYATVGAPGGLLSNVQTVSVLNPVLSYTITPASTVVPGIGAQARGITSADFNGDGIPDLAYVDTAVRIALGNGDGTFQMPLTYTWSFIGYAQGIAVGDFNNDGKPDVAVALTGCSPRLYCSQPDQIEIFLGNGDGTLEQPNNFNVPAGLASFAIADFNRDGKLDIVAGSYFSGSPNNVATYAVLLGNGDGTFAPYVQYSLTSPPASMVTEDLNGDGFPDLAFASGSTAVILLGNGDGTFQTGGSYATGYSTQSLQAADVNGDGKPDLLVGTFCGTDETCKSPSAISVLLGNGDGTFAPSVNYTVGYDSSVIAVADLNGDGKLDIAAGDQCSFEFGPDGCGSTQLSILYGNGDGTFQPQQVLPLTTQADNAFVGFGYALIAVDLVGNGGKDLVTDCNGACIFLQTDLSLSTTTIPFNNQNVDSTSPAQSGNVLNVAKVGSINISNTQITGANHNDFLLTEACPPSLPATQECQVSAVFTPTATGPRAATIAITDSAVGSPHMIALTGTGIAGAVASLSTSTLTFANQTVPTTSPIQTVTLTNTGTATLTISSIATSAQFLARNTCGTSLAPAANCTISVAFKPGAGGTQTGTLTISDNAPGSPQTVTLNGTGVFFSLSAPSLAFGTQTQGTSSQPQTLTLTNLANVAGPFTGVRFSGVNPSSFTQTNNCGSTIAAHGSCSINVTFTPKKKGSLDATVQVGAGGTSLNATLTGTGN